MNSDIISVTDKGIINDVIFYGNRSKMIFFSNVLPCSVNAMYKPRPKEKWNMNRTIYLSEEAKQRKEKITKTFKEICEKKLSIRRFPIWFFKMQIVSALIFFEYYNTDCDSRIKHAHDILQGLMYENDNVIERVLSRKIRVPDIKSSGYIHIMCPLSERKWCESIFFNERMD